MIFPALTWVLLLLSAAFCAVGFYKFNYFSTLGQGLAVAGLGLGTLIIALSGGKSSPAFFISCLLCLLYGLVEGGFSALAELMELRGRTAYKSKLENNTPLTMQGGFWLLYSLLYLLQITPLWYRASDRVGRDGVFSWIALVLMAFGLGVMFLAHRQAAIQKAENPDFPPMQKIYTWARCPAHLGRIVFWIGMLCSGIGYVSGIRWIPVLLGTGSALFMAARSAFRQDRLMRRRYAYLPEYREYAEDTHILIPLLMSKPIEWE